MCKEPYSSLNSTMINKTKHKCFLVCAKLLPTTEMINFTCRDNMVAQASFTLQATILCVLCVTSRAGRRGCGGVTNVSGGWGVTSSSLYNKQNGIKFWKWKQIRKSSLVSVKLMYWPWWNLGLSLGCFDRGESKVINIKPFSLSVSYCKAECCDVGERRKKICHYCPKNMKAILVS